LVAVIVFVRNQLAYRSVSVELKSNVSNKLTARDSNGLPHSPLKLENEFVGDNGSFDE
jgi:hypothetical protein